MEQAQVQYEKALEQSKILALTSALDMAVRVIKDTLKNKHHNKEYLVIVNEFISLTEDLLEDE